MLGDAPVAATLAVKDIEVAKKFYSDTLGLSLTKESPAGVLYGSGSTQVFVYPSSFAGTNKATSAGWVAEDVEAVAAALKDKGVSLEHYDDIPGVKRDGDVHTMGEFKAIWFKDPDGNILSVSNDIG